MELFIAEFWSALYPEDSKIVGVFSTEKKAEAAIADEIASDKEFYPNYPARYQQKRPYYNIAEHELDKRIF
jgi:hypothetical protein